jgi:hypothetical protein
MSLLRCWLRRSCTVPVDVTYREVRNWWAGEVNERIMTCTPPLASSWLADYSAWDPAAARQAPLRPVEQASARLIRRLAVPLHGERISPTATDVQWRGHPDANRSAQVNLEVPPEVHVWAAPPA